MVLKRVRKMGVRVTDNEIMFMSGKEVMKGNERKNGRVGGRLL